MITPRNKKLVPYSRNLRTEPTPQERHLWYDFLRSYPLQFNRQRIIGSYIADFYCPLAKLVIEVDGGQHQEKQAIEYDALRTAYFECLGIRVLRFTNREIDTQFKNVCNLIDTLAKASLGKGGGTAQP